MSFYYCVETIRAAHEDGLVLTIYDVTQIYLPSVQSVDGKVVESNVEFAYFLADEGGSFDFVDAALLASTKVPV